MRRVEIYDTTLRDGSQAEDVSFSLEDKLRIAERLDQLGIDYIEGGWPGANPKDLLFFQEVHKAPPKHAKVVAFGSTRKASNAVQDDANLKALLEAQTPVITIFGKSWELHVSSALGISKKRNVEIIADSIAYLKSKHKVVFYDAEHFFDGYKDDPDYAMKTLDAADRAGADRIILCDTNGGSLPWEIESIVGKAISHVKTPIGIHTHNDSETGVANALSAVRAGAVQVQGTINGFGERCGNANLVSIIPNLKLKMGIDCVTDAQLKTLREVSLFVSEIANMQPNKHQPFVGESAFAHKGGIHVHAVRKETQTYEHISPEKVGNRRRVLISDVSGRSNLLEKAEEFAIHLHQDNPRLPQMLHELKQLENQGYQFEGAEGSFELLMKKSLGSHRRFFDLVGFRVIVEKRRENEEPISEATIIVTVDGKLEHTAAVGNGPVNALDNALRKALNPFYPRLKDVKLLDYKVRVLAARSGTAARVRVLIESGDKRRTWGTVGVSENIIEASWQALVDSIEYKLLKDEDNRKKKGG